MAKAEIAQGHHTSLDPDVLEAFPAQCRTACPILSGLVDEFKASATLNLDKGQQNSDAMVRAMAVERMREMKAQAQQDLRELLISRCLYSQSQLFDDAATQHSR